MAKIVRLKTDGGSVAGRPEWADAYTVKQDAIDALESGDTLSMDGVIYGGLPQLDGLDNITILMRDGPSGFTRFMGVIPVELADLTDEGGGVFSFAAASAPPTVTYGYRQDDELGTVTGVSTLRADIVRL